MPARKPYPSETQDRFIVRMPNGMRDHIAVAAKQNGRSMNAEVVHRLEQTFRDADAQSVAAAAKLLRMTPEGDPLQARVDALEKQVRKLEK